jgi:hypothetical protein
MGERLDRVLQIAEIAHQHADIAPAVGMMGVEFKGLEIGFYCVAVLAQRAQDVAQVVVGADLARVDLQRAADHRGRAIRVAPVMRQDASVMQRLGVVGIGVENFAEAPSGGIEVAQAQPLDGLGELFRTIHRGRLRGALWRAGPELPSPRLNGQSGPGQPPVAPGPAHEGVRHRARRVCCGAPARYSRLKVGENSP